MKIAKKILGVLLALTLLFALSATAFAAGSITVADPPVGVTYQAYKIFDVEENTSGEPAVKDGTLTYKLLKESEWYEILADEEGNSKFAGLVFSKIDGEDNLKVEWKPGFSAADLADFLRGLNDSGTLDDHNLASKTAAADMNSLDPGYYLVVSKKTGETGNQPKAALTTVLDGKNVTIQNKNDMPFDKTVDDVKVEGVQVGQVLNYKIEGVVPAVDAANDTFYAYYVSDTMSDGLEFVGPVSVKINDVAVDLVEVLDEEAILVEDQVRYGANGKTFELSLEMLNRVKADADLIGKDIEITYQAKVTEAAAGTVQDNKAVLEYGNNPSTLTVKDSDTKVYNSQIIIDKFETGAPEQKLQGAEFVLQNAEGKFYNYVEAKAAVAESGTPGEEGYVAAQPAVEAHVEWVDTKEDAKAVVTDTNGAAKFVGLKDGTYKLFETKAPAGYSLLNEPIEIEIDGSKSTTPGMDPGQVAMILTHVANVNNTPGTNLPSTGGIGTTIFYVVGGILMLAAGVILITKKRLAAD